MAGADAAPAALADLLAGRLDGLPDDARAVVRCAAVVPGVVPDRLLRHVSGLPDDVFDAAAHDAVADGVLRPEGAGYRFAHDLVRSAVSADLLPGERARLHGRVADALEAGAGGQVRAAEVAHHVAEAQDAPRVLAWSVTAGDDAMRVWAPDEALQHFERALSAWAEVDAAADGRGGERGPGRAAGDPRGRARRRADPRRRPGASGDPALRRGRRCRRVGAGAGLVGAPPGRRGRHRPGARPGGGGRPARRFGGRRRRLVGAGARRPRPRPARGAPDVGGARARATGRFSRPGAAGVAGIEVDALTTSALLDEIDGDLDGAATRLGDAARLAQAEREPAAELRAHYALACLRYYNGDVAGSLPVLRAALTRVDATGLRWSDSGVELRLLQAVALFVSGDLDASLEVTESSATRPPDVAAARLAAVGCYAAVARGLPDAERPGRGARGELGHRPAGGPGRGRLRGRPADLGRRPGRGRRGRRTRAGCTWTRSPARGCTAGCGCPHSGWPHSPTRRPRAVSVVTTRAWRPRSRRGRC